MPCRPAPHGYAWPKNPCQRIGRHRAAACAPRGIALPIHPQRRGGAASGAVTCAVPICEDTCESGNPCANAAPAQLSCAIRTGRAGPGHALSIAPVPRSAGGRCLCQRRANTHRPRSGWPPSGHRFVRKSTPAACRSGARCIPTCAAFLRIRTGRAGRPCPFNVPMPRRPSPLPKAWEYASSAIGLAAIRTPVCQELQPRRLQIRRPCLPTCTAFTSREKGRAGSPPRPSILPSMRP